MRTSAIAILLFPLIFLACNSNKRESAAAITVELHPEEELLAWEKEMELDRGSRWIANRETTAGIKRMSTIIENSSSSTVDEYKELGDSLISEINILISKCTMKGASHDNLHIFLEPLVIKAAQLEQTFSKEEGARLISELEQHLQAYRKYFL